MRSARLFGSWVLMVATLCVTREAYAQSSDPGPVAVTHLPPGKARAPKLGTLRYKVYEARDGRWHLRTQSSAALGDCPSCTRGVALACPPTMSKSVCKRQMAGGAGFRIEGDRFERLSLSIKNATRLRVGRPEGNTSWPLEIVLFEREEALPRRAAAHDAKSKVASPEPASDERSAIKGADPLTQREMYKIVLDVSPAKVTPRATKLRARHIM